ncbi:hypothetical protein Csa_016351, partial [Cucumis sativus]
TEGFLCSSSFDLRHRESKRDHPELLVEQITEKGELTVSRENVFGQWIEVMCKAAEVFRTIVGEIRFCYFISWQFRITLPYVLHFFPMVLTCNNPSQVHNRFLGFSPTILNK